MVIAGAGPVGCVAGLILARAGIAVRILEAEADLVTDLRASTFHPPTLDMLAGLGISSTLIDQGLVTPRFQYRDLNDGLIAEFDHALISEHTAHPFRLQCEQFKLTRVVAALLAEIGSPIRFNYRVTDLTQDGAGVTINANTNIRNEQFCSCW